MTTSSFIFPSWRWSWVSCCGYIPFPSPYYNRSKRKLGMSDLFSSPATINRMKKGKLWPWLEKRPSFPWWKDGDNPTFLSSFSGSWRLEALRNRSTVDDECCRIVSWERDAVLSLLIASLHGSQLSWLVLFFQLLIEDFPFLFIILLFGKSSFSLSTAGKKKEKSGSKSLYSWNPFPFFWWFQDLALLLLGS